LLLLLSAACGAHASAASSASAKSPAPVVVELFTSEGCSSCPPADALLDKLARDPGVNALELHVDYWNDLGWADPFSDAAFSARQASYGASRVYTPQMIVGGGEDFVGSDTKRARAAIARAAATSVAAVPVALHVTRTDDALA